MNVVIMNKLIYTIGPSRKKKITYFMRYSDKYDVYYLVYYYKK